MELKMLKNSLEKEDSTRMVTEVTVRNTTYLIQVRISLYLDDPREFHSNPSYLVLKHNNYIFPYENPLDISFIDNGILDSLEKQGYWIKPVYMYEHGGITFSLSPFNCSWDSGMVGYIYVDQKRRKEYNLKSKDEWIEKAKREIKMYNQYVEGSVYDYIVWDAKNLEIVDDLCEYSCYPEEMYMYETEISRIKKNVEEYIKSTTVTLDITENFLTVNDITHLDLKYLYEQKDIDFYPISVDKLQDFMVDILAENKEHKDYKEYKNMLKHFITLDKDVIVFIKNFSSDFTSSLKLFDYFTSEETIKTTEIVKKYLHACGITEAGIKEIIGR